MTFYRARGNYRASDLGHVFTVTKGEIIHESDRRLEAWEPKSRAERFERLDDSDPDVLAHRQASKSRIAEIAERTGGEQSDSTRPAPSMAAAQPSQRAALPLRDEARRRVDELRGRVPDDGIERLTHTFEAAEGSADDGDLNILSRWMVATSRPAYSRAVARLLRDPEHGDREFDAEELAAYRASKAVQRAMALTPDSAGGFLLPTHLDPAIVLSSAGSIDPMRNVARQVAIATDTWHGITSAGVTAAWYAEAAEVTDDSPTVDGPSVKTHKASAFVAASIEAAMDTSIGNQIQVLFADSKAQLESGGFTTGLGDASEQPTGVVTALAGTASEVATGGVAAYARADVVGLQESVPPRWRSRAAFMSSLETLNSTREFPKMDGGVDVSLVDDSGPVPRVRGWAWHENSGMAATLSTGDKIAVAGDFSQYLVVDRVGATIEYLPHLLGPNRRPSGQRGWYMFWRTGGDVLIDNAFRLLNVA